MTEVYRRADRRLIPAGRTSLAVAPIVHDGQTFDTMGCIVLADEQDPSGLPGWEPCLWAADIWKGVG